MHHLPPLALACSVRNPAAFQSWDHRREIEALPLFFYRAQNVKGRAAVIERSAVNSLRLLRAVLGRPVVRGSSAAIRMLLPPLLRPLLDLLRPPGCAAQPCNTLPLFPPF